MKQTTYTVEYSSNNSGGGWWLSDENWKALEDDGWHVQWGGLVFCHSKFNSPLNREAPNTCTENTECKGHRAADSYEDMIALGKDFRYMGALAREASIEVQAYSRDLAESLAEMWWNNTLAGSQNSEDEGCNCCGRPHSFWAEPKEEPE